MRQLLLPVACAILVLGSPPAALSSPGPVGLDDVLRAVARNPPLASSIRLQLWRAKRARADVQCTGQRFDSVWVALAGRPVGPYLCPIGDRSIFITATQTYFDSNGAKLGTTDPQLFLKAVRVEETNFRWRWSPTR